MMLNVGRDLSGKRLDETVAIQSPMVDAIRLLDRNSVLNRMLYDIEQNERLMRTAVGPLAELQRAALLDRASPLSRELETAWRTMSDWEARFRLPGLSEATRLMADFQTSAASEVLERYAGSPSSIQRAIETMRTPWLDVQEPLRSITGFAALQGIGHALREFSAFEDHLVSALRVDLGDWRDPITWPSEIFTDLRARSDFYVERGFNPALTDFPLPAFRESLEIADLRREPPTLVDLYGSPVPTSNGDEEEESVVRTKVAYGWLLFLETQMRRFLDERMTTNFGPDWAKHRLPNGLYDQWREKKRAAQQRAGEEQPLIEYADISDYVLVICKRDNWVIFKPFFQRQESVRESFQRLHPIRLDTMHARPITQDDELFLYVEVRRLLKAITEKKP